VWRWRVSGAEQMLSPKKNQMISQTICCDAAIWPLLFDKLLHYCC
jgi:hypothetical protein